ncbi:serine/threonine-protein kinase, partial [Ideonella sp.]|uniref:serine/threonine-protein kinase n=1 Tax=Ideonella sp. TaxID=1929293 RepID=UPI003BB4FE65
MSMINSTSWLRWSDLLDHAMSLRPAERERWLAHLPPADAQAVARLLARMGPDDQAPEPVLPQGPQVFQNLLGQALAEPPVSGLEAGLRFGAWRLARQIGEGGMGQVWLAERADGLYQGQAAIKLLRSDLPRPDLAARFTRERVILSRLSHPGIARLLDAGIEADQAYLVLEYVDGTTLLEYARRHCPTVAQRVQLLLQIAQAVAYAHGQLVVHRDLKPSNVVVSPDGQPRLLDFGIASLLADDAGGVRDPAATSLTRQYGRGLTVDYAAPEQVTGDPCTAATDTFALGVLLFELLTGERPFQSPGRGRVASEHALLHDAPLRVSQALRRVAPSAAGARPVDVLQRAPGDLEAVIDKALQKSPSERYGSAGTLIEDLRAWLESRPVSARRLDRRHRARLWLRRNWLTASLSAAVMLALAGGVVAASWQAT